MKTLTKVIVRWKVSEMPRRNQTNQTEGEDSEGCEEQPSSTPRSTEIHFPKRSDTPVFVRTRPTNTTLGGWLKETVHPRDPLSLLRVWPPPFSVVKGRSTTTPRKLTTGNDKDTPNRLQQPSWRQVRPPSYSDGPTEEDDLTHNPFRPGPNRKQPNPTSPNILRDDDTGP